MKGDYPALRLVSTGKISLGSLESPEQGGNHPLLLSEDSQVLMGMREGRIYFADQNDVLDLYRAEGCGLKVE